jgi:hypothetical protein
MQAATEFNRRGTQSLASAQALAVDWFCSDKGADSLMATWVSEATQGWPITSTGPASEGVGVVKGWQYGIEKPGVLHEVAPNDMQQVLGKPVHIKNQGCKLKLLIDGTTLLNSTLIAVDQGFGNGELAFFTPLPVAYIKSYAKNGLPGVWKPYPGDLGAASVKEADDLLQAMGKK